MVPLNNSYAAPSTPDPQLFSGQRPSVVHDATIFSANGKDPRRYQSFEGAGKKYAMIGRIYPNQPIPIKNTQTGAIEMIQDTAGTGFMVSPCIFATTYHTVFGSSKNPNTKEFSVTFRSSKTAIGRPISWGPRDKTSEAADDWALVALEPDNCIGLKTGFMTPSISNKEMLKQRKIFSAGYPAEKNDVDTSLLYVSQTPIRQTYRREHKDILLLLAGALTKGQSGGPIFYEDEEGLLNVVGMVVASWNPTERIVSKYSDASANIGVPNNAFFNYDLILEDIKNHPDWKKTIER